MYMIELAMLRRKILFEKSFNDLLQSYSQIAEVCKLQIGIQARMNWVPKFFLPNDVITIYKKGNKLRIDYKLKGFSKVSSDKTNDDKIKGLLKNDKCDKGSSIIINPE